MSSAGPSSTAPVGYDWLGVPPIVQSIGAGFASSTYNLRECPVCAAVVALDAAAKHLAWHDTKGSTNE